MVLILKSWTQAVSLAVYLMLALPTEAHPQPKRKQAHTGNGVASGGGARGGAATSGATRGGGATGGGARGGAAGGGGATAAAKITEATDGSMILDKTVNIG